MSSLAAARADNFYYPPEWRPEMGGISKFQGSKGKNQYEQFGIIRFELPYDCWCLGCQRHMCKGLRFNAKKDKDGKYFTTTIWKFTMKCPSCAHEFVIKTDPKNSDYDLNQGIRKMEQDFVPEAGDSLIAVNSDEVRAKLSSDPIFRLEHEKEDKAKADVAKSGLESILDHQENVWKNDYDLNAALRSAHRAKKRRANELKDEGKGLGLSIDLLEPNEVDSLLAKQIKYRHKQVDIRLIKEKSKMSKVQTESIFSTHRSNPNTSQNPYNKNTNNSASSSSKISKDSRTSSQALKQSKKELSLQKYLTTGHKLNLKAMRVAQSGELVPSSVSLNSSSSAPRPCVATVSRREKEEFTPVPVTGGGEQSGLQCLLQGYNSDGDPSEE